MDTRDTASFVRFFEDVGLGDLPLVGGKNASLGELTRLLAETDLRVPDGFVVTAEGFRATIGEGGLEPEIAKLLKGADPANVTDLAHRGAALRRLVSGTPLPEPLAAEIGSAWRELKRRFGRRPSLAVRSSATAEDLPTASFAGQHDSFLNVRGEAHLVKAVQDCFASLYTDRAIAYRIENGFDHASVLMSVGVQVMVRADKGASGVMFSVDPETAFGDIFVINAIWGLGEGLVQGVVDPDEYRVFRPLLEAGNNRPIVYRKLGAKESAVVYGKNETTRSVRKTRKERDRFVLEDDEILAFARGADLIDRHYGAPMDIEWAKDGLTGVPYIVQARPETGHLKRLGSGLKTYSVTGLGSPLVTGLSVGEGVVTAPVVRLESPERASEFVPGSVLVAPVTDPDWIPIMQRAAAIVTDHGGRTSHAAIVCRELGLPGIVGAGDATKVLKPGQTVTVSSLDGTVYDGAATITERPVDLGAIPETRTEVMLNLADPMAAGRWWQLPCDGVGLARMEFIISNAIKVHPMALAYPDRVEDARTRKQIAEITRGWEDGAGFFVDQLGYGIARIAATVYPKPVIVRLSDFKTNEYAALLGGAGFEPSEENPMLGWRGASRYYSGDYADGFALECRALKKVREEMGLDNVVVMVPFCRTLKEADQVLDSMGKNGLRRGDRGLQVFVMCEIPSNVILAREFAERFDGFSIGSNDLTQLTLGVDRDSERLADLFDEEDPAVLRLIEMVIAEAHRAGAKVGLCGQAPSNKPSFARFLVAAGIDSISVTPDSFAAVKTHVAEAEDAEAAPAIRA